MTQAATSGDAGYTDAVGSEKHLQPGEDAAHVMADGVSTAWATYQFPTVSAAGL